jgi:hypothetical protein
MSNWRFVLPERGEWRFGLAFTRSHDGWSVLVGPFKFGRESN